MKNLLFSILVTTLLSGCSPYLFNSYRKLPDQSSPEKNASWFAEKDKSYRFNVFMKFFSHEYSSIIVIKPLTSDSYRALMITELGIKLCDIEIFNTGEYKLHYCIEQMNRKPVIRSLADCLYLMIYPVPDNGKIKIMKGSGGLVIRSKHEGKLLYTFIDDNYGKVKEIIESGYLFKKLVARFEGSETAGIINADISHRIMKLNIHFSRLKD